MAQFFTASSPFNAALCGSVSVAAGFRSSVPLVRSHHEIDLRHADALPACFSRIRKQLWQVFQVFAGPLQNVAVASVRREAFTAHGFLRSHRPSFPAPLRSITESPFTADPS